MRFLIDINDLRLPLKNKYSRVLRAILTESESDARIEIEILDGGRRIVSAQAPDEVIEPIWWCAIPCSRRARLPYWGRAIKLLAFYSGAKFVGKTLTHQQKDDLAWNLAYSFEIFTPSWRNRLAQFVEVDSDPKRKFIFYHWLDERGFTIDRFFVCRERDFTEELSVKDGDIVVLAGTSWRYDIESLKTLKNASGFRLVCLIFDLLPIDYPSLVTVRQRQQYRDFLYGVGSIADLIITPNTFTASRLKTFLAQKDITSVALSTVSLASASLMGEGIISNRLLELGLPGKKFMLCVGSLRERKHILWLYALCTRIRQNQPDLPPLVFAGSIADSTIIRYLSKDPSWGKAGVFIETPIDTELSWLYQNACLCLQPSFEGGLSMAVMEAINYGCRCIAADTPSVVEASSGRAEHLPRDEAIWASAILRLLRIENSLNTAEAPRVPAPTSPGIISQIRPLLENDPVFSSKMGSDVVR